MLYMIVNKYLFSNQSCIVNCLRDDRSTSRTKMVAVLCQDTMILPYYMLSYTHLDSICYVHVIWICYYPNDNHCCVPMHR